MLFGDDIPWISLHRPRPLTRSEVELAEDLRFRDA